MKNLLKIMGILFLVMVLSAMMPAVSSADWFTETVDSAGEVGEYNAIAIDPSDKAHISYFDRDNWDLKYAGNASGLWVTETVVSDGYVGMRTSIAIDLLDDVHISYHDGANHDLKYATNASGLWVTQTVDSAEDVGASNSIAIDSQVKVHISFSYYNVVPDCDMDCVYDYELKYATNASGSWVTETVDSAGDVGGRNSIALDSSDNVHISYYERTNENNGNLKYATNASGSWVTETVDSPGFAGTYTSIALDSSDKVHISYYDGWPNYDLKYATNASGLWVTQTVDTEKTGWFTSIALDSSDKVHISYRRYDNSNNDLKYATNASGLWVTETLGSFGGGRGFNSIAIGPSDKVHISYYDGDNYDLKYVTNASPFEDTDGDGILDDGDSSGIAGDNTCTGGSTDNCDDNCIGMDNPDQADADSNGVGDACEAGNIPPVAIQGGPYSGIEGQAVILDGSGSSDPDGSKLYYLWDIDNDGIYDYGSYSPIRKYIYTQQGAYTVKLRVIDNLGARDEATTTVSISDTFPTANFTGAPTNGAVPLLVYFTNNSTGYDQQLTYEWDFDNNGTTDSTAQSPSYTYASIGTYTVKLTVTDSDGSIDTLIMTDYISVTPPPVLETDPTSITDTLVQGNTSTHTLTLSNTGGTTLTYSVSVTETTFPAGISGVSSYRTEKPPVISSIPEGAEYVPGEIIVRFVPGIKGDEASAARQNINAKTKRRIPKLNMEVWEISSKAESALLNNLNDLSKNPSILYAEPNYIYKAIGIPNDPRFDELWGLHNTGQTGGTADADIDAPEAWDIFTGSSEVVVAVIDTGVDYTHEDLVDNMWTNTGEIPGNGIDDDGNGYIDDDKGWDFSSCAEFDEGCGSQLPRDNDPYDSRSNGTDCPCITPKPRDNDPYDGGSHGTHCSGTIGAVGDNSAGVAGVNHTVRIMAVKFLNDNGVGSTSDAIDAIIYAVDNGANVLSNSWGGGEYSTALEDAIIYANDNDVLFVAAAGNDASDNDLYPHYPSSHDVPNVMAIAATDRNDDLAWFSSYGETSVDLGAPGNGILSTVPGNSYASYSGTSMATPHVAGVAALLKGYNPSLSALDIKSLIMDSVDPVDSMAGKTVTGGRLNANNAIAELAWIKMSGELSGQIQPGSSTDLTVLLDATGKTAGDYQADITIVSDDPVNPVQVVPVTLTVLPSYSISYSISGTVSEAGGGPLAGTTMTLSGNASGTTTTDASGNYTFSWLANGSYTVMPSLAGYTFRPTSRAVKIKGANKTRKNFKGR